MRRSILLAACCLTLAGPAPAGPLSPIGAAGALPQDALVVPTAKPSKAFSRCMRERYGPHYYRGVKRAHRYFMAQACGG